MIEAMIQDTTDDDGWDDDPCERCGRVDVELDDDTGLCAHCDARGSRPPVTTTVDPAELVNVTTIAARTGIPRTRLLYWTGREGFPPVVGDPVATGGRLYLWPAVESWLETVDLTD